MTGSGISMQSSIETRWRVATVEASASTRLPDDGSELEQSLIGNRDFFTSKSLADLAREQGVGPVKDIRVFAGGIPDDEDVDEMLDEIYRLREP